MDFQVMDDEVVPNVPVEQTNNDMSETDISATEESQTKLATQENSSEQIPNSGDNGSSTKVEPFATTSKSKHMTVTSELKNKGIQEFVRILRPHLPRKSKSKAYKVIQNIAKGIIVESTFQRRIRQIKPKRRPQRRQRARNAKKSSTLGGVRKKVRSVFGSSDSCPSEASCPRCGYCCKVPRY